MNNTWTSYTKKYEGLNLYPYTCSAGKLTIGYGHNLENGISPEIAEQLLKSDLAQAQTQVEKNIPFARQLSEVRQFVLTDMCFNMGLKKLLTFKKMLAAVKQGYYARAAYEMLQSRWAEQVGRRAGELAEMMRTGEYQ
jgi:lysozyme